MGFQIYLLGRQKPLGEAWNLSGAFKCRRKGVGGPKNPLETQTWGLTKEDSKFAVEKDFLARLARPGTAPDKFQASPRGASPSSH